MIFDKINEGKSDFTKVYNNCTPSLYFQTMQGSGYSIPESSAEMTMYLLELLSFKQEENFNILDIGCSYGVNSSVLKYGMRLDELYELYAITGNRGEIITRDKRLYTERDAQSNLNFFGFDSADEAVKYAIESRAISDGWSADYEHSDSNVGVDQIPIKALGSIDVILSTGCVGYITERTFNTILPFMGNSLPLMTISYVLRMFDYSNIAKALKQHGYNTARLPNQQFHQRRCTGREEHDFSLSQLRARGLHPTRSEVEGILCADLYVSWRDEVPEQALKWVKGLQQLLA
ncbi:hypothetical protein PsAD2_03723 [Pseudovibrio axinellae]|uniref:Class I SAM-dependent methyltransferase n=1 Tax=Pseudovibrio axinellae TaxID=989403 RepID=A0A161V7Z4_9HYPH|nr:hypothetical protein [Pseudovibrio axinellae]KZL15218.1 hypothetical protein PsAD2_03723 [Pseudovibrio axinellae]SER94128.1 hypothetical protein SAMN05421798_1723 [Pseudovibrio axinellae]